MGEVPERPADEPVLVYDGECGFCRRAVDLLIDRIGPVARPVAATDADLPRLGVDSGRAAREVVLVDAGRVYGGAAAVARLARYGRWPWRPAGRLLSLPGVRLLAAAGYRLAARHRHRLPVPPRTRR